MFGPLGISLAPYIRSSKTLSSYIQPIANWYVNVSGYRKYGFKYDDLCKSLGRSYRHGLTFSLEWWKRTTKSKGYDQNSHSFLSKLIEISTGSCTLDSSRMLRSWLPPQARISSKCSAQAVGEGPMDTRRRGMSQNINTSLEMNEWIQLTLDQDVRYLKPHILNILKEEAERNKWDNLTFSKK